MVKAAAAPVAAGIGAKTAAFGAVPIAQGLAGSTLAGLGAAGATGAGAAGAGLTGVGLSEATKSALISGGLSAGAGLASGLASALLAPDPEKPKENRLAMPTPNPGGVGARPAGQPLFNGRQDINPMQRASLAAQLLQRR